MIKEAIATGSTVEEAKESAAKVLEAIGFTEDVQFEIIDLPKAKTFGLFGGCPAKVKAFVEIEEKPIEKTEKYQRLDKDKKPSAPRKNDKPKAEKAKPEKKEKTAENEAPIVPAELKPFTDDTKKAVADKGVAYISGLLKHMGVEATVKSGETESGAAIMLEGENLGVIVGRRGETLDALQYLTVLAANHGVDGYYRVTLNTGNYREKREKTLQSLARRMANQSLRTHRNITLEPMNPFERRIVHTAVQDIEGVTSWSVGEEPFRKVVIGNKGNRSGRGNFRSGGRGGRGGYDRQRSQSPAPTRENKQDMNDAPLYGKIEK